jgi:4-carboxymuconolactone decarboxylase
MRHWTVARWIAWREVRVQIFRMKASVTQREFTKLARNLARTDAAARAGSKPQSKRNRPTTKAKPATRRARGLRLGEEIYGAEGARALNRIMGVSPAVARDIVDFAYGDVIAEGQLEASARALVVVAALAAVGHARPQLQVHIGSALRAGCTRADITETLRLVALYAGFPAALNGLTAARDAFALARPVRRRQSKRSA